MNFDSGPQLSVEAGAQLGDDFEHFGVRVNFTLSPELQAYGDIGQSELDLGGNDPDGLTFGVGAFFKLDSPVAGTDFAVHGSYHRGELEVGNAEGDVSAITIEGVFSSQEPVGANNNLFWNANIGFSRFTIDGSGVDESDTELMFGAGITMPLQSGSGLIYGGANYIDGLGFGFGYRHFLE